MWTAVSSCELYHIWHQKQTMPWVLHVLLSNLQNTVWVKARLIVSKNHINFLKACQMETFTQARSQLGSPGGAKSFLRWAQMFWTMSNSFKPCPTDLSMGAKKFLGGFASLGPPCFRCLLLPFNKKLFVSWKLCYCAYFLWQKMLMHTFFFQSKT